MKIRFNVKEVMQKEYELDLADSEKVIRRAEEIKAEDTYSALVYPVNFYYEQAVEELLDEDEIRAALVDSDFEDSITYAWKQED